MRQLVIAIGIILAFGCKQPDTENRQNSNSATEVEKIIKLVEVQKVLTNKHNRNTAELIQQFHNPQALFRRLSAEAFASVQDSCAVDSLAVLLNDTDEDVRKAAAFSLGQIKHASAEPYLLQTLQYEQSVHVKRIIIEAIGKCGTEVGLNYIATTYYPNDQLLLQTGQAWALARFAIRLMTSDSATIRALTFLAPEIPEKVQIAASQYFARAKQLKFDELFEPLTNAFNSTNNVFIKANLIIPISKSSDKNLRDFLLPLFNETTDYRIIVNALRGLHSLDYESYNDLVFQLLSHPNHHVVNEASTYLLEKGNSSDVEQYSQFATQCQTITGKCSLLQASLLYGKNKRSISDQIISAYHNTTNNYEKALLLKAISGDENNASFIAGQITNSKIEVVRTTGLQALVDLRSADNFDTQNKAKISEYAQYFKEAILSGDAGLIAIAAAIIREPDMNFRLVYDNTYFLTQALKKLDLPKDLETYIELQKTIEFIDGKKTDKPILNYTEPDWERIAAIDTNSEALIKTTKGDIRIRLIVEEAPVTVMKFIDLVKTGYYTNMPFHRVVPAFVVQTGCPRGDGWGSGQFLLRSEFSDLSYDEGYIGMASAGKDTETTQWFITLMPFPHLDGNYTIFAQVVAGMANVHKLELGDNIISIELR